MAGNGAGIVYRGDRDRAMPACQARLPRAPSRGDRTGSAQNWPNGQVDCILEAGGLQPMTIFELVSPGSILSEGRGIALRDRFLIFRNNA
jgi:hypothetical protein